MIAISPELKSVIDQRITTHYDILEIVVDPEPGNIHNKYTHLVMVAHDNMQKDIWITEKGIQSIISVPYENMGSQEKIRWMKYQSKQNV